MSEIKELEFSEKNFDLAELYNMKLLSKFMFPLSSPFKDEQQDDKLQDSKNKSSLNDEKSSSRSLQMQLPPELKRINRLCELGENSFVKKEYKKALGLYIQAAEEGHLEAIRKLGYLLMVAPPGVEKNLTAAVKLLEFALDNGNGWAHGDLEYYYRNECYGQPGVWEKAEFHKKKYEEFNENYKKSSVDYFKNSDRSMIHLPISKIEKLNGAQLYDWGMHYFHSQQYKSAFYLLSKANLRKDGPRADIAIALFLCYAKGLGVSRGVCYENGELSLDDSKAKGYLKQISSYELCDQGMYYLDQGWDSYAFMLFSEAYKMNGDKGAGAGASLGLWVCYTEGRGTPKKNLAQAEFCLILSYEIFEKQARILLRIAQKSDDNLEKQKYCLDTAFLFFFNAGRDLEGIYKKGKVYYNHSADSPHNQTTAFCCFFLASYKGHTKAPYYLGRCYEQGTGCEKDLAKAFQYYELAYCRAEPQEDFLRAGEALARCYNEGLGVGKDLEKAKHYENIAKRIKIKIQEPLQSASSSFSSSSSQSISELLRISHLGTQFPQPPSLPDSQVLSNLNPPPQNNNDGAGQANTLHS